MMKIYEKGIEIRDPIYLYKLDKEGLPGRITLSIFRLKIGSNHPCEHPSWTYLSSIIRRQHWQEDRHAQISSTRLSNSRSRSGMYSTIGCRNSPTGVRFTPEVALLKNYCATLASFQLQTTSVGTQKQSVNWLLSGGNHHLTCV